MNLRKTCSIRFRTGNISFQNCKREEVANLLEALAKRLREREFRGESEDMEIFDRNGNNIGDLKF